MVGCQTAASSRHALETYHAGSAGLAVAGEAPGRVSGRGDEQVSGRDHPRSDRTNVIAPPGVTDTPTGPTPGAHEAPRAGTARGFGADGLPAT
jgi:hypothetical protein